ncbi:MAG: discoidin domain-containing protein, partial [Nitrososphaeraceae archaeon]
MSAELKPSSIDNKYDIPFVIPSQLGTDLNRSIQLNSSNQHNNSESLDKEVVLGNTSQTNDGMNFALVCSKMPITSVGANANDGNLPTNAIDNNLNTRWSNLGTGSWIQLDLGSKKSICSVDVNWYRGDMRQNNFIISVSNDSTTFSNKFSGTSNLGTTAEKYSLPAGTEGRYVRITVNGNSENEWASITELEVYGLEQASSGSIIIKKQTAPGSNTWIPYKSLGGNIQSDPFVIKNTDNTLQVFAVSAANGELLYKKQTAPASNTWTPYKSLGGNIQSDPSVILNSAGRLEVFQVGTGATTSPPPPPPPPTGTGFPYAFAGSPEDMEDEGWGTRHYASGKPDDITHEWSGETSAQNYAIIIDITLTEIDHDDQISFKFGGTHMGSGWYDNTYSFESGEACIGKEEDHPSTDLCVVTGNSIGNLVDTPVKLAAVNIGKGEKLEMYSNLGSGWIKDVESSNGVDGFRPQVDEDEVVIRIDAAPGILMRSAQIVEFDPASANIT